MPIQKINLGLQELDALIQAFEEKYGCSTTEFFTEPEAYRGQMQEDDIFQWEAFVSHRGQLRRVNDEVRNDYLANLKLQDNEGKSPTQADQVLLAA
jgi:hypothetical protein